MIIFGVVQDIGKDWDVLAIYAAQLVIAPVWLRHFQFGPLEWLWRTVTYGRRQPFRLRPPCPPWAGNPAREG
jgi:uncharacterized protein